jgi:hypothetical protein
MHYLLYLFVILYLIIWPGATMCSKQGGSGLDDRRSQHGQN